MLFCKGSREQAVELAGRREGRRAGGRMRGSEGEGGREKRERERGAERGERGEGVRERVSVSETRGGGGG